MTKAKGFGKYPRYVADDPTINHLDKAMVGLISAYINKQLGYSWMSVKEMALRLSISVSTAQRSLKRLENKGIISRDGYHLTSSGSSRITRLNL